MRRTHRTGGLRLPVALALVLVSSLLLAGCGDLLTGDDDSGRKNWALVIGVSTYQDSSFNLRWADEDALDFYDALRHTKNWDADKITLLTNNAATKAGIKSAIGSLSKRISADDQFVLYFSGRGGAGKDQPPFDEGDGLDEFLAPYDALPHSAAHDLGDDELEALLSALPTNNILVILDTGFAPRSGGGAGNAGRDKTLLRLNDANNRPSDGMTNDLSRAGYILLTATQPSQPAVENNQLRNSVFTYYLVEGLMGAANPGRKSVSVQQSFQYAAVRTSAYVAGQAPQLLDNREKPFRIAVY
jgi:uncharacterized caspase-like protein